MRQRKVGPVKKRKRPAKRKTEQRKKNEHALKQKQAADKEREDRGVMKEEKKPWWEG